MGGIELGDDGAGALSIGGARYLLVRPETLVGLQRAVEAALGAAAAECLAAGGRAGGTRAMADLEADPAARVDRLLKTGSAIGWGAFSLERLTATELVVTVRRSPFAEAYGPAAAPVCHLTRGVLETLAVAVLGRGAIVRETDCAAMGDRVCRFAGSAGATGGSDAAHA